MRVRVRVRVGGKGRVIGLDRIGLDCVGVSSSVSGSGHHRVRGVAILNVFIIPPVQTRPRARPMLDQIARRWEEALTIDIRRRICLWQISSSCRRSGSYSEITKGWKSDRRIACGL